MARLSGRIASLWKVLSRRKLLALGAATALVIAIGLGVSLPLALRDDGEDAKAVACARYYDVVGTLSVQLDEVNRPLIQSYRPGVTEGSLGGYSGRLSQSLAELGEGFWARLEETGELLAEVPDGQLATQYLSAYVASRDPLSERLPPLAVEMARLCGVQEAIEREVAQAMNGDVEFRDPRVETCFLYGELMAVAPSAVSSTAGWEKAREAAPKRVSDLIREPPVPISEEAFWKQMERMSGLLSGLPDARPAAVLILDAVSRRRIDDPLGFVQEMNEVCFQLLDEAGSSESQAP